MPVMPKDAVQSILRPYHSLVDEIVRAAWNEWSKSRDKARFRYARTRANIVFEYMIDRATVRFATRRRVKILERPQTMYFLVDDRLLMRFKRGDENGLSRNYPTFEAMAFNDPEELPLDLPDVQRVDIVYILNDLETRIERVAVVARDQTHVAWSYDIGDEDVARKVRTLPIMPTIQPDASNVVRIKSDSVLEKKSRR